MHIEQTPTRRASRVDLPVSGGGKERVRQFLAFLPKALLAALLVLAILDMLAGVLLRYVVVAITDYFDWPGVNFFWVEEVGELALAWLALIGAGVAIAERTHFELALLIHRFPGRTQLLIERINHVLIAGFGLMVAAWGAKLSATNSALLSPGLEIPLAWLYASAAAGGALIAIYGLGVASGVIERKATLIEAP